MPEQHADAQVYLASHPELIEWAQSAVTKINNDARVKAR
jgi:hypothetical protein